MSKKVLLTATVQSHICQFHKPLVEVLHAHGYEVHVAARDNLAEKNGLALDFVEKIYNVPFARSPKSLDNIKAYRELERILLSEHYDVVHCNTPMGGIVMRLAARKVRKVGTKVFYTAHGFHFYEGAPKKNWIIFYPIEKFFSFLTDKLITITYEDYNLASKKFHCKTEHIHGVGVDTARYYPIDKEEKEERLQAEGLIGDEYVILCVGELNANKDQKTLISASAQILEQIPHLKVLLAGNGPLQIELEEQIKREGLEDVVTMIGYRTDLYEITPAVDLVVSCSYREGMPLNILEAMLSRKPVIASVNRGHKELVEDKKTGFLFKAGNVNGLAKRIMAIYRNPEKAEKMGRAGYQKALSYTAAAVSEELKQIYELD